MSVNFTSMGGQWDHPADIRFVIKNGSQYYISEYTANGTGVNEISAFNLSVSAGLQWGVFNPTSTDFSIPTVLPAFADVDFDDVQEVGVIVHAYKPEYGNDIQLSNFTVNGKVVSNYTSIASVNEVDVKIYSRKTQIIANLLALKGATTVSVFDIKGVMVKSIESSGNELVSINVANKGIYFVQVKNGAKVSTVKVVF